jgi:GDP-D-mannose 3',5'-epimerase
MILKNKKIIVTGGAGFIGSNLVKALVKIGAHVIVIDNLWRGKLDNLKLENGEYAIDIANNFHEADLTDSDAAKKLIKDVDWVYHLADIVAGVNYVFEHELFIFRQNILINTNVLSACMINKIANYVYVGTACSYPKHLQMKDELTFLTEDQTYPAEPESSYGWSKLMGEYEAELAMKSGKINVGLLRFHNVYGPYASYEADRSQVIPALIRKAINYPTEDFVVWGNGEQYRDFVYIDDIINALITVAEKGMNKGLIQIGSGKPTKIKELAELIVKLSKKEISIKFDLNGPQGDKGRAATGSRAIDILNWKDQVTLQKGMENTYRWILDDINKVKE